MPGLPSADHSNLPSASTMKNSSSSKDSLEPGRPKSSERSACITSVSDSSESSAGDEPSPPGAARRIGTAKATAGCSPASSMAKV